MNESFGGIKDTILFNKGPSYRKLFDQISFGIGKVNASNSTLSEIPKFWVELVAFGSIILLSITLFLYSEEAFLMLVPTLSVFIMSAYKLMPAFQQIYANFSYIKSAHSALISIKNDLKDVPILHDNLNNDPPLNAHLIQLSDVVFTYPGKKFPAIKNINLTIKENEIIGIVGHSGSGKSTLIDLILGFFQPSSGIFSVDDCKISDKNILSWQKLLGYVPQSIFLSDTSIRENIAFGEKLENIDSLLIDKVIELSELSEFIDKLPNGIDTVIGERGIQLSGGQRQRIAIARALYKRPKVLILDEATSALDGSTEKKIMESITSLSTQMTIIMVAHRLNTVKNCDIIYFMDKGKIIDKGNYNELVKNNMSFEKLTRIS
jgi:ABC-type multidrug transport system fused ATPase/permease subunit